jgi:hypothetical protein
VRRETADLPGFPRFKLIVERCEIAVLLSAYVAQSGLTSIREDGGEARREVEWLASQSLERRLAV